MSGNENGPQESGMARLLPRVTFGLSAAVLAGVVAVSIPVAGTADGTGPQVVVTTAGLNAAINAVAGPATKETTCCGDPR
jgi:hypothetical protein